MSSALRQIPFLLLVEVACGPGEGELVADCVRQAQNALRVDCVITGTEASARVTLADEARGTSRSFQGPGGAVQRVTGWGLHPQTLYTWEVRAGGLVRTGQVRTAALPRDLADTWFVEGEATPPAIVWNRGCGEHAWIVVTDPRGEAIWYEDAAAELDCSLGDCGINTLSVTDDGAFLVKTSRGSVLQVDPTGKQDLLLRLGRDLDAFVHHEVRRVGETLWALEAELVSGKDGDQTVDYVVDGVVAFDPTGAVMERWSLSDEVRPSGSGPRGGYWTSLFPDAVDWSHANSLVVDSAGAWTISLRWPSTVLRVVDREVVWALAGQGASPFGSDFTITSRTGATDTLDFQGQHHAIPLGVEDGVERISLYDNRRAGERSRVLVVALDGRDADIEQAVELPESCTVQGAAYLTEDQGVIANCAPELVFWELGDDPSSPRFTLQAEACPSGDFFPLMVRAIPLDDRWAATRR